MNFLGKDCDCTTMHSDCQESHDQSHMSWSKVKFPDRNSPSSSAKHQAELGDVVNCEFLEWLQYCAIITCTFLRCLQAIRLECYSYFL